ncbi:uncharacterized protein LOC143910425 isoform X2 [Arctopsyche grandis]|uniref:uncharacterized protein LOC143910425 isoform X2 n=1 Tax=Arctopsyche grandis TaxID=121162 RepID=UPI00406D7546
MNIQYMYSTYQFTSKPTRPRRLGSFYQRGKSFEVARVNRHCEVYAYYERFYLECPVHVSGHKVRRPRLDVFFGPASLLTAPEDARARLGAPAPSDRPQKQPLFQKLIKSKIANNSDVA